MSAWGWQRARTQGIWNHGPLWFRPLAVMAPYLTVVLALVLMHFLSGTLAAAEGLLFELPPGEAADGEVAKLVALVMPMPQDTLVFFDDARYSLGDDASLSAFGRHLSDRLAQVKPQTLLVLADRRVSGGELSKLMSTVRKCGAERVLFATKDPATAIE